ncbi:hypothetical protein DRN75_01900 [Nanoarchaeota archaeon]|nr:MAG: hypothetical protein DRN75_01900 [Nanoarchaeota archaeon]
MKVLFIEARSNKCVDNNIISQLIKRIGKRIALYSTVQYLDCLEKVKKELESKGITVETPKAPLAKYPGQVLGCSVGKSELTSVYIGTGEFHPIAIATTNNRPVIILNPESNTVSELPVETIEKYKRKKELNRILVEKAETIGILVSVKPGQRKIEAAESLKKQLESNGKKAYIIMFDTLDVSQLDNFPFIQAYINTACPRISDDKFNKPIINITDYK